MDSTAKRVWVKGAMGVTANITWRRNARGAMPREGRGVRFPRKERGPDDHLTPLFGRRPLFCPRKRRALAKVRREAKMSNPSLPQWMRERPLWSHKRTAWQYWALAQRPILRALVGLRAIIESWNEMGFRGSPHIHTKQDSVLEMDALGRYAMQQISQWESPGMRARSLRLCWKSEGGLFDASSRRPIIGTDVSPRRHQRRETPRVGYSRYHFGGRSTGRIFRTRRKIGKGFTIYGYAFE